MNEQLKFLVEKANVDRAGVARVAYDFGRQAEQERIIKLLENDMALAIGIDGKCRYEEHYAEACHCDIIALIKGENK